MTFDWTEYLKLANELAKRNDEASLRSSISRAYYGVFCIARNILGYKNYKGKDVHQKVIDKLKQNGSEFPKKLGQYLDELRREETKQIIARTWSLAKNLPSKCLSCIGKFLVCLNLGSYEPE